MSDAAIIFLDSIPEALSAPHYQSKNELTYIASSVAGLKAYQERSAKAPGSLCVWIKSVTQLQEVMELAQELNAQFLFSYRGLRPSEIVKFGDFRGPESLELPDPRINDLSLFSPAPKVLQQAKIESPQVSVVIPVFDNQERAQKALQSWFSQDLENYEIILVDDGSQSRWLEELVGTQAEKLSLVQLSRTRKRSRGDHSFRAGLARNAGYELARGEEIVFCDSDILVSQNTLSHLLEALKTADVVMPQRWQLNEAASINFQGYEGIRFNLDVILSPGAFWESFQTEKKSWPEHENHWRWTSTFLLATHKSALKSAGLFKKSFVTYGFEDTELGLRLHKMNQRFHLSKMKTYHLHQADTHSEYKNDLRQKKRLLRISADRLFRHHPTKEVYDSFQTWLD